MGGGASDLISSPKGTGETSMASAESRAEDLTSVPTVMLNKNCISKRQNSLSAGQMANLGRAMPCMQALSLRARHHSTHL